MQNDKSKFKNSIFFNKRVVIFGLGSYKYGSGITASKFFIRQGARVLITDKKKESDLLTALNELRDFGKKHKNSPIFVLGQHRARDFKGVDIVVRNPGVPQEHKLLRLARKQGAKIHTDVSLFLTMLHAPRSMLHVIGVTGTRGKSTTSVLIAEILKKAGRKVLLGGNLGYSPLNFIKEIQKQGNTETIYVVLELSSWLVEGLDDWKISPDYAVITNIYPDHLNTYASMKDYIGAKAVIFKYQKPSDVLILNKDNKTTYNLAKAAKSKIIFFSKTAKLCGILRKPARNLALLGEHNMENIAAAFSVAKALGISEKQAWQAIRGFKGLWGRLQIVRNSRGIKFYNDTTATTPEATLQALYTLAKLPNPKSEIRNSKSRRIILIAGGMDKNLNYRQLASEIPKYVKALILFRGTASNKLIKELRIKSRGKVPIPKIQDADRSIGIGIPTEVSGNQELRKNRKNYDSKFLLFNYISKMREAVKLARQLAQRGDIILLSPAAASFNLFRNEVDRGEQFVREIKKLPRWRVS